MTLAIVTIILFIAFITSIQIFAKSNLKIFGTILFILCILASGWICYASPQMHKPFSIDIIEYLIKINDDGTMTTTKQVTKTVIKQEPQKDINK